MLLLKHRGYLGTANYSTSKNYFFGRVLNLEDEFLPYEEQSIGRLELAFKKEVDKHIDRLRKNKPIKKKVYTSYFIDLID